MSDVRSLLDQAAAGPAAHPDPVAAVHARVHRRAVRRRALAAAGTAGVLVLAGLGYAVRPAADHGLVPDSPPSATPSGRPNGRPSGRPSAQPTEPAPRPPAFARWRLITTSRSYFFPTEVGDGVQEVSEYVVARPYVFAYLHIHREGLASPAHAATIEVAVGRDEDAALWRARLTEVAAGRVEVTVVSCGPTAREFDRMKREAEQAKWPSGNRVLNAELVDYPRIPKCTIALEMKRIEGHEQDSAYARERWGGAVALLELSRGPG